MRKSAKNMRLVTSAAARVRGPMTTDPNRRHPGCVNYQRKWVRDPCSYHNAASGGNNHRVTLAAVASPGVYFLPKGLTVMDRDIDTLTVLLMDPFLTCDEAEREAAAVAGPRNSSESFQDVP